MTVYVGSICKVVLDRGFAFIRLRGSNDVFCHASELRDLLFDEKLVELEVEFEMDSDHRGLRAKNVRAVKD